MPDETITLRLVATDLMSGNVTKAVTALDKLSRQSGLTGWAVKGMALSMGAMLNPAMLVTNAIGGLVQGLGDAQKAYREDQVSQEKLRTALEANIPAWDGNVEAVEKVIASRMRLGFADDQQRESLALLVAQVQDVNDALAIQRTAMDFARLKNVSLAEASTLLAKAYNGSTTSLQKMGIQLGKGVRGMDAIAAVQRRAAGQAQAYAETTQGAMEVSSLAFDEFKESVGGALDDALQPFFKLVVDLTNQTPDLDTNIGKLTQAYRDQIEAMKLVNEEGQKQGDIFYDIYSFFAPQDRAIHDFTGTLGDYARILGVSRKELALFTEAGLTAGKTLPELKQVLDSLVRSQVAERAKDIGYAWQLGMVTIEESTVSAGMTVEGALAGMHAAVRKSIGGSLRTLDSQKEPWRQAWKEYAEYAKDPFKPKAFEEWLATRAEKALQKADQAAKDGKPKVAERWRELARAMSNPVTKALVQIGLSVEDAIAAMNTVKTAGQQLGRILPSIFSVFGTGGGGGTTGNNANGTPYWRGGWTWVGERGPELMRLPQGTQIKSNPESMRMDASPFAGRLEVVVRDPDGGLARAGMSSGDLGSSIAHVLLSAERTAGMRYSTARR